MKKFVGVRVIWKSVEYWNEEKAKLGLKPLLTLKKNMPMYFSFDTFVRL